MNKVRYIDRYCITGSELVEGYVLGTCMGVPWGSKHSYEELCFLIGHESGLIKKIPVRECEYIWSEKQ